MDTPTTCGHCHTCGVALQVRADSREYCPGCCTYRDYLAHGRERGEVSTCDSRPAGPTPEELERKPWLRPRQAFGGYHQPGKSRLWKTE